MGDVISFRLLSRADFPLLQRWSGEPHVVAWWNEPLDLAGLESKYGPRIDGIEPTRVFMVEHDARPIGWIQWYRWVDYPAHAVQLGAEPETAGIDFALGELAMTGRGIGPRMIRQFLNEVIFRDPTITAIVCDPEENNVRSLRAFEKVGFTFSHKVQLQGENVQRCVVRLSR